jgi:hypothetical protein
MAYKSMIKRYILLVEKDDLSLLMFDLGIKDEFI